MIFTVPISMIANKNQFSITTQQKRGHVYCNIPTSCRYLTGRFLQNIIQYALNRHTKNTYFSDLQSLTIYGLQSFKLRIRECTLSGILLLLLSISRAELHSECNDRNTCWKLLHFTLHYSSKLYIIIYNIREIKSGAATSLTL